MCATRVQNYKKYFNYANNIQFFFDNALYRWSTPYKYLAVSDIFCTFAAIMYMNARNIIILVLLFTAEMAMAQSGGDYSVAKKWRAGITMGCTVNWYEQDMQYQYDWKNRPRPGMQFGASGQYNFNEWLGLRADLIWMQKDYRHQRAHLGSGYIIKNSYLQLPVMASFSFGGQRLKGFMNAGIYGGAWLSSYYDGYVQDTDDKVTQTVTPDSERDQRLCFGYVGGAGVEYRFSKHIIAQLEGRMYYDVTSQVKQYQNIIHDYRYNTTLGIQTNIYYCF